MKFKNITIIILAMDETYSLKETVDIILSKVKKKYLSQILIVLNKNKGSNECKNIANSLSKQHSNISCIFQQKPFAGGSLQEGFEFATGSHIIMMSADLETDPNLIPFMIEQSRENPENIITISRWGKKGGFEGYNKIKLFCNYLFQKLIAFMFFSKLTDITYAYRLIPTNLVKRINWKELKHPMFLETAIVPLRLGIKFTEIPGKWKARTEGISQNSFFANFQYFKTAFRIRFTKKNNLIKR